MTNKILGCSQAVRHGTLTPAFVGPNPATPARKKHLRKQVLFSIQSEGLVCNHDAVVYGIAAGVWHHASACIRPSDWCHTSLRDDSIRHFVPIPYRNKLRIPYTPSAWLGCGKDAPKPWTDSRCHTVWVYLPDKPYSSAFSGRRGRRPLKIKIHLQTHRSGGVLDGLGLAKQLKKQKNML